MTKAKIRDTDMTAKYPAVSLLTVLRIVGTFTPGCINLISRACMMTSTKTVASVRTGGWFSLRDEEGSDEMLTKGKSEGSLSEDQVFLNNNKTYMIRLQRNIR